MTLLLAAGLLTVTPAAASAQAVNDVHLAERTGTAGFLESERFRFEPWAGALWDAYRNDGGNGSPAWLGAVRVAYELGGAPSSFRRWRVIGEVARAEAAKAGTAIVADSLLVGFRTEWWLTTAGIEWDAITGWMGVTLEAQGGAAWLEREIVGGDTIPSGTPGTNDRAESEPFPAAVIGVAVWRHLTHSVQIRLRVEDVISDPFEALEHSPAIGLGFRFVFE